MKQKLHLYYLNCFYMDYSSSLLITYLENLILKYHQMQ